MRDRPEPTVRLRTLARAIEIANGADKLAAFLGLPLADIEGFARDGEAMPMAVFLALMDIVAANALPAKPPGKKDGAGVS